MSVFRCNLSYDSIRCKNLLALCVLPYTATHEDGKKMNTKISVIIFRQKEYKYFAHRLALYHQHHFVNNIAGRVTELEIQLQNVM